MPILVKGIASSLNSITLGRRNFEGISLNALHEMYANIPKLGGPHGLCAGAQTVARSSTDHAVMSSLAPSEIAGMKMSCARIQRFQRCEVVRIDPMFLVNSRQLACHYETIDGDPLIPGYYLALWPTRVCRSYYGRELRYLGPFASKIEASWLQTSALGLGIVNPVTDSKHPAPSAPGRTPANKAPFHEVSVGA